MSVSHSTIARSVAGQLWPDVQQQKKLAKGTYWFSCAGHGGLVALVDDLDLDPQVIEAARKHGLIHTTIRVNHGRRSRVYSTAAGYRKTDLEATLQRYPNHAERFDVWVGEEDVEWSTLALVDPNLRDGMAKNGFTVDFNEIHDTAQRYFNEFTSEVLS